MSNRKLNLAMLLTTIFGIIVFWCERYSMVFIRNDKTMSFLPILWIMLGLAIFFVVATKVKMPKWSVIAAIAIDCVAIIVTLAFLVVNIANFPHFISNLKEILPFICIVILFVLVYATAKLIIKKDKTKTVISVGIAAVLLVTSVVCVAPTYVTASPVVFDTGENFTVEFLTTNNALGFVDVETNGVMKRYFDIEGGKKNAATSIHQIEIPKEELFGKIYRIGFIPTKLYVTNKTWFGNEKLGSKIQFKAEKKTDPTFMSISDMHVRKDKPIKLVNSMLDKLDFLIANGDLLSFAGNKFDFENLISYLAEMTKGQIPVYFSRGNHEMMGVGVHELKNYIPTENDEFYYSFKYGDVFGVVNDLGEDKADEYIGFSGLAESESYRKNQMEFVKTQLESEACQNSRYVLQISHIPLITSRQPIQENVSKILEAFNELSDNKSIIGISGHTHKYKKHEISETNNFVIVEDGGNFDSLGTKFSGTLFTLSNGEFTVENFEIGQDGIVANSK